ncbi:AraC family transcriptional regulator [Actinoplanes bogorensis]|uniref:AraC family transcriptional regulator n=1 Tax=Paractinoplanes bogorensis TaxID=1610840 RepID=A0ABS5YMC5_9ACTN|nr:AraC family transcriptional regulator [Actinoplanes bogorensis]
MKFRFRSATVGEFGADIAHASGVRYLSTGDPIDYLLGGVILDGTVRLRSGRQEARLARDDAFLYPIGAACTGDGHGPALADVRVPMDVIRELAAETTGLEPDFTSLAPVSPGMGRYWSAVVAGVTRQLAVPGLVLPALLAEQMLRFVGAGALAVFPNTTMTAARFPPAGRTTPAVVRRAQACIEANADQPLRLSDVAAASGVGVRALQLAFRRHLGTTPMAYLRRVRLQHVRVDLRAAVPGDNTTVAATARRWGFGNLSRFAGEYRDEFGELPSRTLGSRPRA